MDEGARADEVAAMLMDVNNRRIDSARAQQARAAGPHEAAAEPSVRHLHIMSTYFLLNHRYSFADWPQMDWGVQDI